MVKIKQQSFISLSVQALKLIPTAQRIRIIKNLISSVVLAGLEVLSLAVIFPLLQLLMSDSKSHPNSLLLKTLNLSDGSLHWIVLLAIVVGLYLSKNFFAVWQMHKQARFLDKLYVTYAEKIYQGFFQQSWTEYTKKNSSESFRKIRNTAYEFTHNVLHSYLALLPEALICLLMIIVVIWIDLRILFVLALLILPIVILYFFFRKNVIHEIDKSFRELTPQANIILAQGIDSFAEARIYAKETYFIQHFIAISKITTHQLSRLKTFINLPSRIIETIGILCFSGIIIYGKFFPEAHQHLLIFLVMLSLVIYRIIPSINKILTNVSQIQAYAYVVSELEEILKENRSHANLHRQEIDFKEKIEIKSVFFQYDKEGTSFLLEDLSFKINKGDFIVLEGASGAGKTTVLHLLAGLIDDYAGQILIDNTPLTKDSLKSWQAKLGFVQQAPIILQDTILHNLAFGMDDVEVDMTRAHEVIQLTGLADLINSFSLRLNTAVGENGLTLSGGQRQRLALARALYRDPKVLLLDEVTNQLDEENKLCVLRNLQQLSKQGKTILLVSHDPLAKNFANRVFLLEDKHFIEISAVQSTSL
jgi:ABC-type bacteriocin/lantibiotic exporter with double-glycine peptidase domain